MAKQITVKEAVEEMANPFPPATVEHHEWCGANGCRCGKCPCMGPPACVIPPADGKAMCPTCGGIRPVIATAYGFRMPCEEPCKVRWTRIRGEVDWVAESYSPLADNRTFDET